MSKHASATIAITGAGGFLGSALVKHFSDKGWRVRALVRDTAKYPPMPGVDYQEFNMVAIKPEALKGADYLVHTAYIKYDRQHPDAFAQNVGAARELAAQSRKFGLKHTVFISSMSSHEGAISVYGRQKLAIEGFFGSPRDVSFRCGLIVGDGGIVGSMTTFMQQKHVVPLIDGGMQPLQIIGLSDLVRAVDLAFERNVSGVLTIANPKVYTYKEFYKALAQSFGIKVLFVPVPFGLLLSIFRVISLLRLPLGVGEDSLQGLKALRSVNNADDLKKLGLKPKTLQQVLTGMHSSNNL